MMTAMIFMHSVDIEHPLGVTANKEWTAHLPPGKYGDFAVYS
jgi:hypothetical protein